MSAVNLARGQVVGLLLLWATALGSALAVVMVTQHNRQLFAELEHLRNENNNLRAEWGRYLLEQSSLAAYSRVEEVAQQQLEMAPVRPEQMVTLR